MSKIHGPAIMSVGIKPTNEGKTLLINIICVCNAFSLTDQASNHSSSQYQVEIGAIRPNDKFLKCECGNEFTIHPQRTHVHVFSGRLREPTQFGRAPERGSTIANVRIEPADGGRAALIDVVCACGLNGLKDEASNQTSFKHRVELGSSTHKILGCDCGNQFTLQPQRSSIHIFSGQIFME